MLMPPSGIPDDVRRFLLTSALSVPHVEATLLVRREQQEPWTAARLAARLYVPEPAASRLLADLAERGVVAETPNGCVFRPATPQLAAVLEGLDHAYARHLVEVTRLIHRARDESAEQFAAAFRFRKDT